MRVEEIRRLEVGFRVVDPGPPATITPFPVESLMLTGDENLVDVKMAIQARINRGSIGNTQLEADALVPAAGQWGLAFLFNVFDPQRVAGPGDIERRRRDRTAPGSW